MEDMPEGAYFDDDGVLRDADGNPLPDGLYKDANGRVIVYERTFLEEMEADQ